MTLNQTLTAKLWRNNGGFGTGMTLNGDGFGTGMTLNQTLTAKLWRDENI